MENRALTTLLCIELHGTTTGKKQREWTLARTPNQTPWEVPEERFRGGRVPIGTGNHIKLALKTFG